MKATRLLATCTAPDGAELVLQEHDGHHFLKVAGFGVMSTKASFSEEQMAELACAHLPVKPRVLIGGLGFGFTLKRVAALCGPDARIEVAELIPEVVTWNRDFLQEVNGKLLEDARVRVHVGDVYHLMDRGTGPGGGRFHAILLDVDNGPDALLQRLNRRIYQGPGLERIRQALHPGGRVVFWSSHPDPAFARDLGRLFRRVETVRSKEYAKAKRPAHTLFVADRD